METNKGKVHLGAHGSFLVGRKLPKGMQMVKGMDALPDTFTLLLNMPSKIEHKIRIEVLCITVSTN